MIYFWAVCLHMVGDYITQTSWMANEKVRRWLPAWVHGVVYTLPFLLLTQNVWALLIIGGTHAVIDHYRLAKHFIWLRTALFEPRRYMGDDWQTGKPLYAPRLTWVEASANFGFSKDTPAWLAGWLMFITDNIIHNAINFGALYWFEVR